MHIIVRNERRINPRDPASHPDFKAAKKLGEENYKNMTFKSEGERRDYIRAVESNPNNVMGLPPFYPAQKTRVTVGMEVEPVNERFTVEAVRERIRIMSTRETRFYCRCKEDMTSHIISTEDCFCQLCGTRKPMRIASSFASLS